VGGENKPLQTGALIYILMEGRLDNAVKAVKSNGGKLLQDRQQIARHGFRAVNLDSEGNQIALHSSTA
jgi:predicted enzyme related to lactoylglutathione lyase